MTTLPLYAALARPLLPAIATHAAMHGLDRLLVQAVVEQESSYNPKAYRYEPYFFRTYLATRPEYQDQDPVRVSASYGLMQVMYPTAVDLGYDGEPEGLYSPSPGLEFGCRYLRKMLDRFHRSDTPVLDALAAYNGGPGGVTKAIPRDYARRVLIRQRRIETEQTDVLVLPPT